MPLWLEIICYYMSGHILVSSLFLWFGIVPWPYDKIFRRTYLYWYKPRRKD